MTAFTLKHSTLVVALSLMLVALGLATCPAATAESLTYGWQAVDGINIFYREGGNPRASTLVFLHGNPASSIQYEKVMERIAGATLHVIAMDYPSFGYSDAPPNDRYHYTFDHVAETVTHFLALRGIQHYGLFMQDYGVPVGFRLIMNAPESISAIIVQNGVIHLDGFPKAQDPNSELRQHWQHRNPTVDQRRADYFHSLTYPNPAGWDEDSKMSPDAVLLMQASEQRPGVLRSRNDLWFDYGHNVERYPQWQTQLRKMNVPVLVLWGSRDDFFTTPGALAYLNDAPRAEIHILDTVHFATLEAPEEIASLLERFLEHHGLAQADTDTLK